MEIKVLEIRKDKYAKDKDKNFVIKLLIKDADITFLNALRRFIMEEVPTLAIEDVYVHQNDSALWDEFIAHRLGLIPLNTPKNVENDVKLKLEAVGPGWVYSGQIISENKEVYPIYDKIPIVWLEKGQKLKLEMVATLGTGKEHAKWSPAHVYYYKLAEIKIKGKLTKDEIKLLEELGVKVKNNKIIIPKDKEYDRTFLDAIQSALPDKIEIVPKNDVVFVIESFGQYSAEEIIPIALSHFKDKIQNLISKLIS